MSRKQDCVSGSSTHAEMIAASANSNDVVWARGYLAEIGLPQDTEFNVDANNVITLVHHFRGGDRKNGVLASSPPYFCECGVLSFVLQ